MNDAKKKQILARLARIEGQIRGVSKLVNSDVPDCEKIAQQMAAARKALDKTSHTILACMLEKQLVEDKQAGEPGVEEMVKLISKYV